MAAKERPQVLAPAPLIARDHERVAGLAAKRTFTIPCLWPFNPQGRERVAGGGGQKNVHQPWPLALSTLSVRGRERIAGVAAKRTFTVPGPWPLSLHSLAFLLVGPPGCRRVRARALRARANDRVREEKNLRIRGVFRIRAREGITAGHATPSGPAAAHLEPRICRSRTVPPVFCQSGVARWVALTPTSRQRSGSRYEMSIEAREIQVVSDMLAVFQCSSPFPRWARRKVPAVHFQPLVTQMTELLTQRALYGAGACTRRSEEDDDASEPWSHWAFILRSSWRAPATAD